MAACLRCGSAKRFPDTTTSESKSTTMSSVGNEGSQRRSREKGSFMESAILLASHSHEFGAAGGWWPIFPLLWFALIVGGFFFFGSRMRRGAQQHPFRSGEAVLAERYARGEVTEEEYRERLAVLRQRRQ